MMERTGTTKEALFIKSGAVASLEGMRNTRVVSFCSMLDIETPYSNRVVTLQKRSIISLFYRNETVTHG